MGQPQQVVHYIVWQICYYLYKNTALCWAVNVSCKQIIAHIDVVQIHVTAVFLFVYILLYVASKSNLLMQIQICGNARHIICIIRKKWISVNTQISGSRFSILICSLMDMSKLRPLTDWSWVRHLFLMLLLYSSIVQCSLIFRGDYPLFFMSFAVSRTIQRFDSDRLYSDPLGNITHCVIIVVGLQCINIYVV